MLRDGVFATDSSRGTFLDSAAYTSAGCAAEVADEVAALLETCLGDDLEVRARALRVYAEWGKGGGVVAPNAVALACCTLDLCAGSPPTAAEAQLQDALEIAALQLLQGVDQAN